jgi:hypothetical protein
MHGLCGRKAAFLLLMATRFFGRPQNDDAVTLTLAEATLPEASIRAYNWRLNAPRMC